MLSSEHPNAPSSALYDFPDSLPSLEELLSTMRVVRLPMNTCFRGVTFREIALFHSPHGWVEFSPFLEYAPSEASAWLASALDAGWRRQPQYLRTSIPVNATLPDVPSSAVPTVMQRYGDLSRLHTVKVKVGGSTSSFEEDLARLRALRSLVGEEVRVRVDVNGAWTFAQALDNLSAFESIGLEYAEQPVATVEDMARLREALAHRRVGIKIAADENIRKADDPLRVKTLGAADIVVVKAQPLGGAHRILDIVAQIGLPAVVSSALDSAVGIALGARVAASLPSLEYACGLGTGALFDDDLARGSAVGSVVDFMTEAGWVQPDVKAFHRLAVEDDRYQWWEERVRACYRSLVLRQVDGEA